MKRPLLFMFHVFTHDVLIFPLTPESLRVACVVWPIFSTGGPTMNLPSLLDELGINYRLSRHDTAYTAADLAHAEHIPGRKVIKPVVVKADGQFVMCALPASHR